MSDVNSDPDHLEATDDRKHLGVCLNTQLLHGNS